MVEVQKWWKVEMKWAVVKLQKWWKVEMKWAVVEVQKWKVERVQMK